MGAIYLGHVLNLPKNQGKFGGVPDPVCSTCAEEECARYVQYRTPLGHHRVSEISFRQLARLLRGDSEVPSESVPYKQEVGI